MHIDTKDWLIPLVVLILTIPLTLLGQRLYHKFWPKKKGFRIKHYSETEYAEIEGEYPENVNNVSITSSGILFTRIGTYPGMTQSEDVYMSTASVEGEEMPPNLDTESNERPKTQEDK